MSLLGNIAGWLTAVLVFFLAAPAVAHEETEMIVGQTAGGQLTIGMDFQQPIELDRSIFAGIFGYATGEVAFHSTILDDTNSDSFQLSTSADLRFILVAKDPGMEVIIYTNSHFAFLDVGASYYIGVPPFDTHPIWNLANGTPGNVYSLTLKIRDVNGVYPDSAPFTLSFTPAPVYELQIKRENSGQATLSWPTNAADDWTLESATAVSALNWVSVSNAPAIAGTNFSVTIPTDGAQQFFRLRKL